MSLVPANIDLDFTAVYAGSHRVCYRIGGVGSYTCITVSCVGGTTSCLASIPIFVDNETCVDVSFDGYIQPTCIDIASSDERFPFSVLFTPSPVCKSYTVTCNTSTVTAPTITNGGTLYDPLSPPSVLFTGGGSTGATGEAVVGGGAIVSTLGVITDPGSGYVDGTYSNVDITGGTGTGAQATVIVVGGAVTSITITTVGNGYLSSDTLGLDYTDMSMGVPPATSSEFTVTTNYGVVTSITILTSGSGYTSAPNVTIGVSGGVQATATGNLAGCPSVTSTGCDGATVVIPANVLNVGDTMAVCNIGGVPAVSDVYSAVLSGNCLCTGNVATITVSGLVGEEIRYFYNRLNGGVVTGILTVGGSPSAIVDCVILDSVKFQQISDAVGNVSYGGAC